MIIGYDLSGPDNGSEMSENAQGLEICPDCGSIQNWEYTNPRFQLRSKKYDVSSTYDNRIIVSDRFRQFCMRRNLAGATFTELPRSPGFFHFQVDANRVVNVCTTKHELKFGERCSSCGRRRHICGFDPLFLKRDSVLGEGFYRTDLFFASRNERQPAYLVSPETKSILEREEFFDLIFAPVFSESTEYLGAGRVAD